MSYWFQHPLLKLLFPLSTSTSMRGLATTFRTPHFIMGANVLPEGPSRVTSTIDFLNAKCPRKRAFVVTDEGAERFGKRLADYVTNNGYACQVWAKALPEAPIEHVAECAEEMKKFEPDLIIAVGGGSVIDGAKAAWILYERPDITDLGMVMPMVLLGLRKKAVLAAVPTTSGTGSECTAFAVLHDTATHRKIPIVNPDLTPDFAILVPEFTMTMPPRLTVNTGLDALSHAMDAVITPSANEWTDAMSLSAIKQTFKYLPRAYRNGRDREARFRMQIAASAAGIGFGQSAAALTHSFGHTIGSLFHVHHGLAVGIFIPYVFEFYKPVTDKYLEICHALNVSGAGSEKKFRNLMAKTKAFFRELDVPLSLKELGVPKDEFNRQMETMVLYTVEDVDCIGSPRPMTAQQCEQIFRYAYDGKDIDF